jgi:hypothetical protein
VAEGLCSGLQSRVRRFETGPRLQHSVHPNLQSDTPYRIDVLGDVLRLEVLGILPKPGTDDAVTTAVKAAREKGCRAILFDIRKANNPDFHAKVMQSAKIAIDAGIKDFRVALVGVTGSPLLKFIDDVTANRGLPVRVFADEESAMKWLAPDRKPKSST